MFDLTGKVALVAGGSGFLGLPACAALARQGAAVIIASRNPERVASAVTEVREASGPGRKVSGLSLDIGDEESIRQVVATTVKQFGRLDILVNATSASIGKPVEELSGSEFDRANHLHITGPFPLAREAARAMVREGRSEGDKVGGSIIQYVSMYGLVSPDPRMYEPPMTPNPIEYGVAKAGLCQIVRYLAAVYGPRGVRVNAIAPGPFNNPDVTADIPGYDARVAARTMLNRIGRRDETAGAVVFLASDEAAYVTGEVMKVDGGWTAW